MGVVNALAASGFDPLYIFFGAVLLDDVVGVLAAVRTKSFDFHKLPSFLASQFGTKQALVVAAAAAAAYQAGGDAHQAALALVAVGGGAMTLAVARDIFSKVVTLVTGK